MIQTFKWVASLILMFFFASNRKVTTHSVLIQAGLSIASYKIIQYHYPMGTKYNFMHIWSVAVTNLKMLVIAWVLLWAVCGPVSQTLSRGLNVSAICIPLHSTLLFVVLFCIKELICNLESCFGSTVSFFYNLSHSKQNAFFSSLSILGNKNIAQFWQSERCGGEDGERRRRGRGWVREGLGMQGCIQVDACAIFTTTHTFCSDNRATEPESKRKR